MNHLVLAAAVAALASLAAAPAGAAGSPNFAVSLYQCSEMQWGGENVGDNCITGTSAEDVYEAKLEQVESSVDDPEDGDE